MGGFLGDVLDFEKFNLKGILKKIKKDPERLLIGAVTPVSSALWGGVTGKDYEPLVNQMGGATGDTYTKAKEAGINTGPGRTMHSIAEVIASFYGGRGAAKGLGNATSGGTEAATSASTGSDQSWMNYAQMSPGQPQQTRNPRTSAKQCISYDLETGECLDEIQTLTRYNSNEGPYNDKNTMRVSGGNLYWLNNDGDVIGIAPADQLSRAFAMYEQDIKGA